MADILINDLEISAPGACPVDDHFPPDHADCWEASLAIETEEDLNAYLCDRANLQAEQSRVQAQAARMILTLESRLKSLDGLYLSAAEAFVRKRLEGQKSKTLHMLQGSCSIRKVPASLKVVDEDAAIKWVFHYTAEPTQYLTTRTFLNKSDYRALAKIHLRNTGELLDGIERTPERETFNITCGQVADPFETEEP